MPEPDWNAVVRARLASDRITEEVIEEIAQHAADVYRDALDAGRSDTDARTAVEAEMRDVPALLRAARAASRRRFVAPAPEPVQPGRLRWLSAFARDLAYAARVLVARPAFTAIALATLALGIGANTAIFSVVHAILLEPLPFPRPDRLVAVWEADATNPASTSIVAAPNFEDWKALSTSFAGMAIWEDLRFNIAGDGEPEQVAGLRVSASVFAVLGVTPQLGRAFTDAEDPAGHDVVVISDALWRRRYGANPGIVGQRMRLNGKPFDIIGVMPASFAFTHRAHAVWIPIAFTAQDRQRGSHSFYAVARLKDGVSFGAAQVEMQAIGRQLEQQYPDDNNGETATITPLSDVGVVQLRPALLALSGAVGLVLLIACVNVANLLLAQSSARQHEFAIRTALGAGLGRLASQLLAEGLLIAGGGAILGIALALAGTSALADSLPPSITFAPFRRAATVSLDATVLSFTAIIAMGTGVLFSLAPIVSLVRSRTGASLRRGGRGTTPSFTAMRSVLMTIEVALAVIVLVAAGLMVKSMGRLVSVDPGLRADHVLTMDVALPQEDTYGPPQRTTFCDDLAREVSAVAGVSGVSAISHMPLSGANAGRSITIEGRPMPAPGEGAGASYRLTCPGYFATLGIPLVRGRDFTPSDSTGAPGVVIINEATAARYWPGGDPLGQRIKLGDFDSRNPWLTIVGIVRNVRHFGLDSDVRREMFRPYAQAAWPTMTIAAKTTVEPLSVAQGVKAAVMRIDPGSPVSRVRSMEQIVADSTGPRRFPMLLLSLFSAVALVLAAIGVYGVVSYVVSQRTREIGIRMALGARAAQVTRMVMRRALAPIGAGIVAGIAGARLASTLLASLLYQVTPGDPVVLLAIVVLLASTGAVACLVPARRAATVDPLVVLKEE